MTSNNETTLVVEKLRPNMLYTPKKHTREGRHV